MSEPIKTRTSLPAILGDYRLLEKIGQGVLSKVYRARRVSTGKIVAVKVLLARKSPLQRRRFEQEFQAARGLNHPHLVRALDYDADHHPPFLVMEYVAGQSLGKKLEREGRMPEAPAIALLGQVCRGLQYAHERGLIHRDVNPNNILVTPAGLAKLADFGLVKRQEADLGLTQVGLGMGTPQFMAPEQFCDAKGVDRRCDVFSLGATLYTMVTGRLPYRANGPLDTWRRMVRGELIPPRKLVPTISAHVDRAIRRAMSFDPAQRPANSVEFLRALGGIQEVAAGAPQSISQRGVAKSASFVSPFACIPASPRASSVSRAL